MRRIHLVFGLVSQITPAQQLITNDALFVIYEVWPCLDPSPSDCEWMIPGTWIED